MFSADEMTEEQFRLDTFLKGEKERGESLLDASRSLSGLCSEYLETIDSLRRRTAASESFALPSVQDEAAAEAEKFTAKALGHVDFETHAMTACNKGLDLATDFSEYVEDIHFDTFIRPAIGVHAAYRESKIFVWLPHLPAKSRRFAPTIKSNQYHKYPYDYGRCYADEVSFAVRQVVNKLTPKEAKAFADKTLNYYFIYPCDTKQPRDADNHDTKIITDSITGWLPNGDAARHCFFYFQTVLSDSFKTGKYVIGGTCVVISPGNSPLPFASVETEVENFSMEKIPASK